MSGWRRRYFFFQNNNCTFLIDSIVSITLLCEWLTKNRNIQHKNLIKNYLSTMIKLMKQKTRIDRREWVSDFRRCKLKNSHSARSLFAIIVCECRRGPRSLNFISPVKSKFEPTWRVLLWAHASSRCDISYYHTCLHVYTNTGITPRRRRISNFSTFFLIRTVAPVDNMSESAAAALTVRCFDPNIRYIVSGPRAPRDAFEWPQIHAISISDSVTRKQDKIRRACSV